MNKESKREWNKEEIIYYIEASGKLIRIEANFTFLYLHGESEIRNLQQTCIDILFELHKLNK